MAELKKTIELTMIYKPIQRNLKRGQQNRVIPLKTGGGVKADAPERY
jgi:hypothetical protein